MSHPLAVFLPRIGTVSETFIRRHMEQLLPGRTVAVANSVDAAAPPDATDACPTLVLDRANDGVLGRMLRAAAKRTGRESGYHRALAAQFLRRHRVQVILGEYLDLSYHWIAFARRQGIRFVAHAHGYDASRLLRQPVWRARYERLREADAVITVNRIQRERLIGLGVAAEKIHVIPTGVDVPDAPPAHRANGAVRCLAVGRMVAKKAPIILLESFRQASQAVPSLELDLIGGGPLFGAAQQYVQAAGLGARVRLHGAQPHAVIHELMARADIFLQHSMTDPETGDEEGLPVAIQEAMAARVPVVSTRHAGIPEAVVEEATGLLVDEGDGAGMAQAIARLARDPSLRARMGQAGWERAMTQFRWDVVQAKLLDVLQLSNGAH